MGYAFQFQASGGTQLGGLALSYKVSALLSNTGNLQIALYSDSTGNPGTLLATGTPIAFSNLTTSYATLVSKIDYRLTVSSKYWIVFTFSTSPVGGNVMVHSLNSGSNTYGVSGDLSTWSLSSNHSPWFLAYGYLDNGRIGKALTHRGLKLTGKQSLTPRQLSVYVPPMTPPLSGGVPVVSVTPGEDGYETPITKNDMIVTIIARNGENGVPVTFTQTVPAGTSRDTRFTIGTSTDLFDRVDDVQVVPGSTLQIGAGNVINWSVYDMITVETLP
jgi:hypothetical protein